MANSAELTRAEISAYLGEKRTEILDNFKEKEWEYYESFQLDPHQSYFALGDKDSLAKFEAYFLFLCGFEKPLYKKYMILEYSELLRADSNQDESLNMGVDNELVILYSHNVDMGIGNTDLWVYKSVLNKVVCRNREGNPTLILSERAVSLLQNSGEMKVVNLGGGIEEISVADALNDLKKESSVADALNSVKNNSTGADVASDYSCYNN